MSSREQQLKAQAAATREALTGLGFRVKERTSPLPNILEERDALLRERGWLLTKCDGLRAELKQLTEENGALVAKSALVGARIEKLIDCNCALGAYNEKLRDQADDLTRMNRRQAGSIMALIAEIEARPRLSAGWEHLPCVTTRQMPAMPARALCRRSDFGPWVFPG
jgi:regulator of replication initiation timing